MVSQSQFLKVINKTDIRRVFFFSTKNQKNANQLKIRLQKSTSEGRFSNKKKIAKTRPPEVGFLL